jgi:hypothetical protein
MHADAVRMINLLECLSEDHPVRRSRDHTGAFVP